MAVGILVRAERVAVGLVHRDHPPAQGQPQHNSALIVEGTGEENEAAAARAHSHDDDCIIKKIIKNKATYLSSETCHKK